jgi:hypothetical protein
MKTPCLSQAGLALRVWRKLKVKNPDDGAGA